VFHKFIFTSAHPKSSAVFCSIFAFIFQLAIDVVFHIEVTGQLKFAFVVTVQALPVILQAIAFVTSKSVNHPFNTLLPVTHILQVIVRLFAHTSKFVLNNILLFCIHQAQSLSL
jgi:hypothetical protein